MFIVTYIDEERLMAYKLCKNEGDTLFFVRTLHKNAFPTIYKAEEMKIEVAVAQTLVPKK